MTATAADERRAGRALRERVPRSAHEDWNPAPDRADPVETLRRARREWIAALVPVRFERMRASPLAFLRGAAAIMAADLAPTPRSGLTVQAIGDAHLLNFGGFASPDKRLLFDVDDFDETLPGPWEWDVKRLATSIELAARELGGNDTAALAVSRGYRESIASFAAMAALDLHRYEIEAGDAVRLVPRLAKDVAQWSRHTSRWELPRLTAADAGTRRIVSNPPLTQPVSGAVAASLQRLPLTYARTLADDRRTLLSRYEVLDVARHTVGIGSCGTRCYVILLADTVTGDPLFLQVKEAGRSALEPSAGRSRLRHPGHRVVSGQRLAQPSSDPLLGWSTVAKTPVYVRQLRDMRGGVDLRRFKGNELTEFAALCGTALARAHARTGRPAAIAGYLGGGDRFDRAVARFAGAYADQTERDHEAFVKATKSR